MERIDIKNPTPEKIKSLVDSGKKVYADSALYKVIKDKKDQYLIMCGTGHYIGLSGQTGTEHEKTLNATNFFYIE